MFQTSRTDETSLELQTLQVQSYFDSQMYRSHVHSTYTAPCFVNPPRSSVVVHEQSCCMIMTHPNMTVAWIIQDCRDIENRYSTWPGVAVSSQLGMVINWCLVTKNVGTRVHINNQVICWLDIHIVIRSISIKLRIHQVCHWGLHVSIGLHIESFNDWSLLTLTSAHQFEASSVQNDTWCPNLFKRLPIVLYDHPSSKHPEHESWHNLGCCSIFWSRTWKLKLWWYILHQWGSINYHAESWQCCTKRIAGKKLRTCLMLRVKSDIITSTIFENDGSRFFELFFILASVLNASGRILTWPIVGLSIL